MAESHIIAVYALTSRWDEAAVFVPVLGALALPLRHHCGRKILSSQ